jgi:hypothetical protein
MSSEHPTVIYCITYNHQDLFRNNRVYEDDFIFDFVKGVREKFIDDIRHRYRQSLVRLHLKICRALSMYFSPLWDSSDIEVVLCDIGQSDF